VLSSEADSYRGGASHGETTTRSGHGEEDSCAGHDEADGGYACRSSAGERGDSVYGASGGRGGESEAVAVDGEIGLGYASPRVRTGDGESIGSPPPVSLSASVSASASASVSACDVEARVQRLLDKYRAAAAADMQ
jgi:hypothetical protein